MAARPPSPPFSEADAAHRPWPEELSEADADSGLTPSERDRKIFIGGLSWLTTEDTLLAYFRRLNVDIDRVVIMREKASGRSRGFGFVIVTEIGSVDRVVGGTHVVDGKKIEAKKAIPKAEMNNPSKKIFVGGVALNVDDVPFRAYFESFGRVVEAQIIRDRTTGRSRGFGFVTFHEESAVDAVVNSKHVILGKEVEVKMAEPRKQQPIVHHVIQPVLVPSHMSHGGYAMPGFPGMPFMMGMPGMPGMANYGMPQMTMGHNKNMAVPIPMPMSPQFMNHFRPEAYGYMSPPPQQPQPQPYSIVTEEERELLEQLRARKRASEQPPQPKQLSVAADPSRSPPSLRKQKSLSDDPRKRRPRTLSRDGEPDDLDLDSLRLDGYDGPEVDSASPRARLYPEIVVNPAVAPHNHSRSSTPASASTSTTPLWSENEQRHTPPSPHLLFSANHPREEVVNEEAAIVYGFNSSMPHPPRPSSTPTVPISEAEAVPSSSADWTFIASRPESSAASVGRRGGGHSRQRSAGSSVDYSPRSPFPNLTPATAASHIRARSQDVPQGVVQQPNPLTHHFRVHSTGTW